MMKMNCTFCKGGLFHLCLSIPKAVDIAALLIDGFTLRFRSQARGNYSDECSDSQLAYPDGKMTLTLPINFVMGDQPFS